MELTRPLILASASPRRAELLAQIGLAFTACASDIDEPAPAPGENLLTWITDAAGAKARAMVSRTPSPALVLSADTVVVLPTPTAVSAPLLRGGPVAVLGKPRDADDATRMLCALSGITHTVITAFALLTLPEWTLITHVVETRVQFRDLSADEIAAYIRTGEPLDKAGAYGIQGIGAILVEKIVGDYYTVVGLPLARLYAELAPWRKLNAL
jgi:septum formation protein